MKAELKGDWIVLSNSYPYKELIKVIPGRRWEPDLKVWTVPATMESIEMLQPVVKLDQSINSLYQEQLKRSARTEGERLAEEVEPIAPMPIKVKPFQHQIRGYNMALQIMGVME